MKSLFFVFPKKTKKRRRKPNNNNEENKINCTMNKRTEKRKLQYYENNLE